MIATRTVESHLLTRLVEARGIHSWEKRYTERDTNGHKKLYRDEDRDESPTRRYHKKRPMVDVNTYAIHTYVHI